MRHHTYTDTQAHSLMPMTLISPLAVWKAEGKFGIFSYTML